MPRGERGVVSARGLGLDDASDLSDAFLDALSSLGFALTGVSEDTRPAFSLTRFALGNHLHLTIEPLGPNRWRVGLEIRTSSIPLGRLEEPTLPFALGRFGTSPDGIHLELSRDELENRLPDLLADGILPVVDLPGARGPWPDV